MMTTHWIGGSSGYWGDASNWSTGSVPDATTDVVIDTNSKVIIGGSPVSFFAHTVLLNAPGADLDFQNLAGLHLTGDGSGIAVKSGQVTGQLTILGGTLSSLGGAVIASGYSYLQDLTVAGTLTFSNVGLNSFDNVVFTGKDGTGRGSLILKGSRADIGYIDNVVISMAGDYSNSISSIYGGDRGLSTINLGANVVVNAVTGSLEGDLDPGTANRANNLINQGQINCLAGSLAIVPVSFTNTGALTIAHDATISISTSTDVFTNNGVIALYGGTLSDGAVTGTGVTMGWGHINSTLGTAASVGNLYASAGKLVVGGAVSAGGTGDINSDGTLEYQGKSAQAVTFNGSDGVLKLDQPDAFTGTISGVTNADVIDLAGRTVSARR